MEIKPLLAQNKWRFAFTLLMVLAEAALMVLFPLVIGMAVDDAIAGHYRGATYLGALGLATLIVGASRRMLDSRFYARLYQAMGAMVGTSNTASTSTRTARLGLLTEVIDFFEDSLPGIVNSSIGLVGTLIIIAGLNLKIFAGCAILIVIVVIVYGLSQKATTRDNAGYNNELEQQVTIIGSNKPEALKSHLARLMRWNIKLSDREATNFSVVWVFMMAFLIGSIVLAVGDGVTQYGALFSLVLYLFQFIENASSMPLFYQQWLRLVEIMQRLKGI